MENFEIISAYTRAQAIDDGFLVDVSSYSKGLFKVPVATTRTVYEKLTDNGKKDVTTTLFLLLLTLKKLIRAGEGDGEQLDFTFNRISLKALSHGGDNGEHVITIMFPHED
jgi:hypothetical protein